VFDGPRLCDARYPDVLAARACSDPSLVLYPGRGAGEFTLSFDRLRPGARYTNHRESASAELIADAAGRATLSVPLSDRTTLRFPPASTG
jgi:hypothetical protein